jgi:hypothetical protein
MDEPRCRRLVGCKVFEDWMGRRRLLVEDFDWFSSGAMAAPKSTGFSVLDHLDDNKVMAGR